MYLARKNMTSTLFITSADFGDTAHIHVIQTLINELATCNQGREEAMTNSELVGLISGLQNFSNKEVLLAQKDGVICGIAVCFYIFSTFSGKAMLKLHDLYVTPNFRAQSIGRHLVEHCIGIAKTRDCAFVTLEVALDNPAALALYERLGFIDWMSPTKYLELRL